LFLGGTAVAVAADPHPEAQPAPGLAAAGTIQRPGDEEWYSLPGDELNQTELVIDRVRAPASCAGTGPLRVGLYNPEGSWMRAVVLHAGSYSVISPHLPGRYLVKLSIENPACSGLGYTIRAFPLTTTTRITNGDAALACKLARQDLTRKSAARRVAAERHRNLAAANRALAGAKELVAQYHCR
jgi:hypothetical protein